MHNLVSEKYINSIMHRAKIKIKNGCDDNFLRKYLSLLSELTRLSGRNEFSYLMEIRKHFSLIILVEDVPLRLKYTNKMKLNIQSVTGGTNQTSGECSLGQTIPI